MRKCAALGMIVISKTRSTTNMTDYLDEDGYPTDVALGRIETWPYNDPKGWFNFINDIWYLRSWGWTEGYTDGRYQYHISTAGWSGNESIIRAMQQNDILWSDAWVQSRRGGHYIFELKSE